MNQETLAALASLAEGQRWIYVIGGGTVLVLLMGLLWLSRRAPVLLDKWAKSKEVDAATDNQARIVALQNEQIKNDALSLVIRTTATQEATINELRMKLTETTSQLVILREQSATSTRAAAEHITRLEKQVEALNDDVSRLQKEAEGLRNRLAESERTNKLLTQQLDEKTQELKRMQSRLAVLEAPMPAHPSDSTS